MITVFLASHHALIHKSSKDFAFKLLSYQNGNVVDNIPTTRGTFWEGKTECWILWSGEHKSQKLAIGFKDEDNDVTSLFGDKTSQGYCLPVPLNLPSYVS